MAVAGRHRERQVGVVSAFHLDVSTVGNIEVGTLQKTLLQTKSELTASDRGHGLPAALGHAVQPMACLP